MARASVLKLLGAFLAGLVIALASAVTYVRMSEKTPAAVSETLPQPPPVAAPTDSGAASAADPAPLPLPATGPETAPAQPAVTPKAEPPPPTSKSRRVVSRPRVVHHPEPEPPVQVVQNTPGPLPEAASSTYPPLSNPAAATPAPGTQSPESATVPAPPPQPHVVELAAGTQFAVRLSEALSTENNYSGDTFRGTLEQPLIREGFIIADKGSRVLGRVTDATPAGRVKGVSSIAVTLTEINTTDGQRIHVNTNAVEKRGPASTGTDAAKIAGGAALGAVIGALGGGGKGAAIGAGAGGAAGTGVVLATRGKAAKLPNESLLTFQLAEPVTITEKLNH